MIYLDNNATTKPAPEVVAAMLPYFEEFYGNPSSIHRFGQRARQAIEEARVKIASLVGCKETELVFTASGTESVNSAIRGFLASRAPRRKIVTSTVEHSATRELCNQLEKEGCQIVRIPVNQQGDLDLDALTASIDDETALASFIWANNETGVIFPIPRISDICKQHRVPFHTDGTQAVGKIHVNLAETGADAMSFAAHKFHGPKGVAALYLRRGARIRPLLIGGPQERNRRGGTENVPGIVGMGTAADLARDFLPHVQRVRSQRDHLEQAILTTIDETHINGRPENRVPNTSNISFAQLEAEAILLLLSEQGVCASAGAACSSGSLEPSPVLQAMKLDPKIAHGAVRFSLSRYTTDQEIDQALAILPRVIARLRQVLPVGA